VSASRHAFHLCSSSAGWDDLFSGSPCGIKSLRLVKEGNALAPGYVLFSSMLAAVLYHFQNVLHAEVWPQIDWELLESKGARLLLFCIHAHPAPTHHSSAWSRAFPVSHKGAALGAQRWPHHSALFKHLFYSLCPWGSVCFLDCGIGMKTGGDQEE
jgi:hypothetical protein